MMSIIIFKKYLKQLFAIVWYINHFDRSNNHQRILLKFFFSETSYFWALQGISSERTTRCNTSVPYADLHNVHILYILKYERTFYTMYKTKFGRKGRSKVQLLVF